MKQNLPKGNMELMIELNKTREVLSNFFNQNKEFWGTPFMSAVCRIMGDIESLKNIIGKNEK